MLLLLVLPGCSSSQKSETQAADTTGGETDETWTAYDDPIADRLDSLAALSVGDYVHLQIGPCFGSCEGRASLYSVEGRSYRYSAESGGGGRGPAVPVRRAESAVPKDEAEETFRSLEEAGIYELVPDSTMVVTDLSHFWLRARIGETKITIDNAYLGGERYFRRGDDRELDNSLMEAFHRVRGILYARLPQGK